MKTKKVTLLILVLLAMYLGSLAAIAQEKTDTIDWEKRFKRGELYVRPEVKVVTPKMAEAAEVYRGAYSTGIASAYAQPERSSSHLSLRKSFDDETVSKRVKFEVDDKQKSVSFKVYGQCKTGEIIIRIITPGGELFQEVAIDASADIEWSKTAKIIESLNLQWVFEFEKEDRKKRPEPEINEEYIGTWILEIQAKKAKGNYLLTASSY